MDEAELQVILDKLAEHYDSVIVLGTTNEDGVTKSQVRRRGNYFACRGLVQHWLDTETATESERAILDMESSEEEDE